MRLGRALTAAWILIASLPASFSTEPAGAVSELKYTETQVLSNTAYTGANGYRYQPLLGPNPVVQEMIGQVNEETLSDYIGGLSGEWPVEIGGEPYTIQTRNSYSGVPIQKSSEYLFEYYQAAGLPVVFQEFALGDTALRNVIAEIPGELVADQISMITAHYDNAPSGPVAPGADDNASGTAAVMLAASILSQYDFACTLRFANFSGEEQGLVGSKESARQSFCEQEKLRAVLNLDMIGWNTPGSQAGMDLYVNETVSGSLDVALLFQDVIETYALDLTPEIVLSNLSASDHASYWVYDFPAILVIEDIADFNPNYHETTDQLDQLDLPYLAEIAMASLATMAHLSCPIDSGWGTISGRIADVANELPIPDATISFYHPEWDLSVGTTTDEEGNYNLELAASGYIVTADALGFSLEQIGFVSVAPGDGNTLDVLLQPSPESANFLPLVQDFALNPACP